MTLAFRTKTRQIVNIRHVIFVLIEMFFPLMIAASHGSILDCAGTTGTIGDYVLYAVRCTLFFISLPNATWRRRRYFCTHSFFFIILFTIHIHYTISYCFICLLEFYRFHLFYFPAHNYYYYNHNICIFNYHTLYIKYSVTVQHHPYHFMVTCPISRPALLRSWFNPPVRNQVAWWYPGSGSCGRTRRRRCPPRSGARRNPLTWTSSAGPPPPDIIRSVTIRYGQRLWHCEFCTWITSFSYTVISYELCLISNPRNYKWKHWNILVCQIVIQELITK